MSSSEEDTVVQSFINNVKKNTVQPIEIDVTDLINAGFINKDNPTSTSAMKEALLVNLSAKQKALQDATASVSMLSEVLQAIQLSSKGSLVLDMVQEPHKQAKQIMDAHVSLNNQMRFDQGVNNSKLRKRMQQHMRLNYSAKLKM